MNRKLGIMLVSAVCICALVLWASLHIPHEFAAKSECFMEKPAIAEAATLENISYVYLINPMIARLSNGDTKIVYCITVCHYTISSDNTVLIQPYNSHTFGKRLFIPLYNIKAIVEGENGFKEHVLDD